MGNLARIKKPVIFQDETTFNSWSLKMKSWQHPDRVNEHVRPGPRFSVTVYGAIGTPLTGAVFSLGTSTNQVEYREFVRKVKRHQKTTVRGKALFLFDGHPAHRTDQSLKEVRQLFHPVMNVPYTCELNSIETYWSVAKSNFGKLMLMHKGDPITKEQFEAAVVKAITMIPNATVLKIIHANRRYLRELIKRAANMQVEEEDADDNDNRDNDSPDNEIENDNRDNNQNLDNNDNRDNNDNEN